MTFQKFAFVACSALLCGCGLLSPQPAPTSSKRITKTATDADVEAIRDLLNRLTSAINTNNPLRATAVFTDDATLMPHGEDTVVGDDNIRAWLEGQFTEFTYGNTMMVIAGMEVSGNWASAHGPYHQVVTPRNGGVPVPIEGKYLVTFERQPDGNWKVANAIWNLNELPEPRPAERRP